MVAWFWTPELRPLLKGIDLSAPCCSFEMMAVWHSAPWWTVECCSGRSTPRGCHSARFNAAKVPYNYLGVGGNSYIDQIQDFRIRTFTLIISPGVTTGTGSFRARFARPRGASLRASLSRREQRSKTVRCIYVVLSRNLVPNVMNSLSRS